MGWAAILICFGMTGVVVGVAAQEGIGQTAVDEAVRLGTVAALAPVCGLRDEAWTFDLRRAVILKTTHSEQPADLALKAAPGSELIVSALSFAEAEALESFAEGEPAETCGNVARSAGMGVADDLVKEFRILKARLEPGS